jgi:hypothetical protein
MTFPTEYSTIVSSTLAPVSVMADVMAQTVSRIVTVGFGLICFLGFAFMVIKRQMSEIQKAIFLTGAAYSVLGVVLYALGSRALPIVFVPVSLGVVYVYQNKSRKYLSFFILILVVLFVFIPIHSSFGSFLITFQTRETQTTANFMIEQYNWTLNSIVIADVGTKWYITPQIQGNTEIIDDYSSRFVPSKITTHDCIIYSVGLAKTLQLNNVSIEETSQMILDRFNVIYNSGSSYIATKSR